MRRFLLSRTFRAYVLAVLSVLLAVSLRTVASPGPEHRAGLLLLAAVTITTWYGGLWPGLVALVFAASCDAWILPPPNSFSIASRDDVERLVGFILMAGLVTAMYTSRRRAERQVIRAEQRMNAALSAARIGCWEVDIQSGTFWNSSNLPEIYGHPVHEFSSTYEGFFAYIHPEDRDFVRLATVNRGSNATYYEIVHRVVDAAGGLRWVCTRGRIFMNTSDKVERMVGAVYLLDNPPVQRAAPAPTLQSLPAGNVLVADAAQHD
jgi:PAS domain-containing protein